MFYFHSENCFLYISIFNRKALYYKSHPLFSIPYRINTRPAESNFRIKAVVLPMFYYQIFMKQYYIVTASFNSSKLSDQTSTNFETGKLVITFQIFKREK